MATTSTRTARQEEGPLHGELAGLIEALRHEGVEKGETEARAVVGDAQKEAARILEEARKEAERLLEGAKAKATGTMRHLDQQISLALRDLLLKARSELTELVALRPIRRAVKGALHDPDFIKKLISSIIAEYTKSELARGARQLHICIPAEMQGAFVKEWMAMMRDELEVHAALHAEKGLAGFRLFREGGGGELVVDAASIVDVLKSFVSERFHQLLDEQAKGS